MKVKKKKEYSNQIILAGKKYTLCKEEYLHKEKGNWVNGENLDKIKFPCFCSYVYMNVKHFGELRVVSDGRYGGIYTIFNLCQEKRVSEFTVREFTLKAILENYDIHILKGKVIIFYEEEEK